MAVVQNMDSMIGEAYSISDWRLGGGAFGDVWMGTDLEANCEIAAKIAVEPSIQVSQQDIEDAFLREQAALSRIDHPNVIRLRDYGLQDGRRYLILDFIDGQSLWTIFRAQQASPTMSAMQKVQILMDLAKALGETHECGYVHLDVKPENVIVTPAGRAVLIDFGSALTVVRARAREAGIETHAYCAPEQIQGTRWAASEAGLSPRTDVFAFGIVAWELLTLRRPFGEENGVQLRRIAHENPEGSVLNLAPDCPPELAALLGVCLNKNPQSRYASMGVVAERLENIAAVLTSRTRYAEGDVEGAIHKAEEAVAASPDLQEARDLVLAYSKEHAAALAARGEGERARECLQRARDHCWGSLERLNELRNLEDEIGTQIFNHRKITALVARAERDRASGNHAAAEQYFDMARSLDANHPLLKKEQGRASEAVNAKMPGRAPGRVETSPGPKIGETAEVRPSEPIQARALVPPQAIVAQNLAGQTPRPVRALPRLPAEEHNSTPSGSSHVSASPPFPLSTGEPVGEDPMPNNRAAAHRIIRTSRGLLAGIAAMLALLIVWLIWPRAHVPGQIIRRIKIDGTPVVKIERVKSTKTGWEYQFPRKETPTPTYADVPPGEYEVVAVDDARKEYFVRVTVSPDHDPDTVVFRGFQ